MNKQLSIKANQILGLEILPSIYMLAILNMILMGDGSSNIINADSLLDYKGNYAYGDKEVKFPATAFILNPPYSAEGKGMIFVEKALSMMNSGYASIIIQNSAGTGEAKDINKRILLNNTLLASIKMPIDIFVGKSAVQTYIYVFKVNEKHNNENIVKFIDFSNDGYTRRSRKKAKSSVNLRDTDRAKERYDELVKLVLYGKEHLDIFTTDEYYEGKIDILNGADWNQKGKINLVPNFSELEKTVNNFMAWEVDRLLNKITLLEDNVYEDISAFENLKWIEFRIDEIFTKIDTKSLKFKVGDLPKEPTKDFPLPSLSAGIINQGLNSYVPYSGSTVLSNVISVSANGANTGATFYQKYDFTVLQDSYAVKYTYDKTRLNENQYLFLTSVLSKAIYGQYEWTNKAGWERIRKTNIKLPVDENKNLNFEAMEKYISSIKKNNISKIIELLIKGNEKEI